MATLTNTKIKDTYDGLLKTTDNEALDVSGVTLIEDGLGNASALSVGRSGNGVSVSGNLAVDTNTLYVDAANNRVGVGTSSPATVLDVTGDIHSTVGLRIGSATDGTTGQFLTDGTNTYLDYNGFLSVRRSASSAEAMRIDSSGNVGIGVTPNTSYSKLQVKANESAYALDIIGRNAGTDSEAEITFWNSNQTTIQGYIGQDNGNMLFGSGLGASERMRIDSSGNVGIGIVPSNYAGYTTLCLNDTSGSQVEFFSSGVQKAYIEGTAGILKFQHNDASPIVFSTNAAERMRIDSSGNVGIGLTPSMKFQVKSSGNTTEDVASFGNANISDGLVVTTNGNLDWGLNARNTRNLTFSTNQSERMRITSGGDVFFGCTSSPSNTVFGAGIQQHTSVDGTYFENSVNSTSTFTHFQFANPNGNVGYIKTSGSSTSYLTSSDYRLKENVVEMTGALDRVDALKPSRFNFIADPNTTVDGFIAHEVAEVVPEAISGEKDAIDEEGNPIYQGIDQSKIVPLLVGAIKELRAEIELLKSQLNA